MEEENRGTCWLVILAHTPVIYMFTPKPPTPMKSVSHLFFQLTHFWSHFAHTNVYGCVRGYVCMPKCVYACLAEKVNFFCQKKSCSKNCEKVSSAADMWHGAKLGKQPLSISMVYNCPNRETAPLETGWECWGTQKLHIAKKRNYTPNMTFLIQKILSEILWTMRKNNGLVEGSEPFDILL